MSSHYYIDNAGTKDGPHDLVTIMRRIRAQKVGPDTGIYVNDATTATPAIQVHDLSIFFNKKVESTAARSDVRILTLQEILHDSWRFVLDHSVLTVFSGGLLLLIIMGTVGLVSSEGVVVGGTLSWVVIVMLHYLFFVYGLRMYRGQPLSAEFMQKQLAPVIPVILFAAIIMALMLMGGFFLLVFPGLGVAVHYIFVPFFIADRRMNMVEAMHASRLLVQKHNRCYQSTIAMLVLLHVACMVLIVPIPLTMPMFMACAAKIYEELSAS